MQRLTLFLVGFRRAYPRATAFGVACLVAAFAWGAASSFWSASPRAAGEPLHPRTILGRPWFSDWPETHRDEADIWFFGGGGFGVKIAGSNYRYGFDYFELERAQHTLDVYWLQDKRREGWTFDVRRCEDEAPAPFDACLTIEHGGERFTVYSWAYDDEMPDVAQRHRRRLRFLTDPTNVPR
ncbi:MAG: hypothetical protein AAGA56_01185 [Myxococcota bacterium]